MAELLYVGLAGGVEERAVPAAGIRLVTLPLTTPDGLSTLPKALFDMARGLARVLSLFRDFRPQVLFSTGGFVSLPAAVAAWILRVPTVIFLPDVKPGRAVLISARLAKHVAVSTSQAVTNLPRSANVVVTGYPLRRAFAVENRKAAREGMRLAESDLFILVMGGSLGSRTINHAVIAGIRQLLDRAHVFHVCGGAHLPKIEKVQQGLPTDIRLRYHVVAELDEHSMARVMFAADLAVTRAGASILGELPAAGVPAIVVPLPAGRVGQDANAGVLVRHQACVVVSDSQASDGGLVAAAVELLEDSARRKRMAAAMAGLAKPNAARQIAALILADARTNG